jgi:hypothetical protein
MNKEIKEKWTAALRSGEYTQTKFMLRNITDSPVSHCCLGVLAEIVEPSVFTDRSGTYVHTDVYGPAELEGSAVNTCVNMNDAQGKTFAEIADWIDEKL